MNFPFSFNMLQLLVLTYVPSLLSVHISLQITFRFDNYLGQL